MANEYYAVILDVHSRYVELGFAGESGPVVRADLTLQAWQLFAPEIQRRVPLVLDWDSPLLSPEQQKLVETAESEESNVRNAILQYQKDLQGKKTTDWSIQEFRPLARLVRHLLLYELLVSPDGVKLFVVDLGWLVLEKTFMCRSLLSLTAVSAMFLPRDPCICISGMADDALVVDLLWPRLRLAAVGELRVVSVLENREISQEAAEYAKKDILSDVPAEIVKLVRKLPLDLRPLVALNVLFVGDLFELFSAKQACVAKLRELMPNLPFLGKQCLGAWAGASVYCSSVLLVQSRKLWRHREVTIQDVNQANPNLQKFMV